MLHVAIPLVRRALALTVSVYLWNSSVVDFDSETPAHRSRWSQSTVLRDPAEFSVELIDQTAAAAVVADAVAVAAVENVHLTL